MLRFPAVILLILLVPHGVQTASAADLFALRERLIVETDAAYRAARAEALALPDNDRLGLLEVLRDEHDPFAYGNFIARVLWIRMAYASDAADYDNRLRRAIDMPTRQTNGETTWGTIEVWLPDDSTFLDALAFESIVKDTQLPRIGDRIGPDMLTSWTDVRSDLIDALARESQFSARTIMAILLHHASDHRAWEVGRILGATCADAELGGVIAAHLVDMHINHRLISDELDSPVLSLLHDMRERPELAAVCRSALAEVVVFERNLIADAGFAPWRTTQRALHAEYLVLLASIEAHRDALDATDDDTLDKERRASLRSLERRIERNRQERPVQHYWEHVLLRDQPYTDFVMDG
ncbi:MAG: hypothetical protein AAF432_09920 [Planctomycetota bacterium]